MKRWLLRLLHRHRWRNIEDGISYHDRCEKCGAERTGVNYG